MPSDPIRKAALSGALRETLDGTAHRTHFRRRHPDHAHAHPEQARKAAADLWNAIHEPRVVPVVEAIRLVKHLTALAAEVERLRTQRRTLRRRLTAEYARNRDRVPECGPGGDPLAPFKDGAWLINTADPAVCAAVASAPLTREEAEPRGVFLADKVSTIEIQIEQDPSVPEDSIMRVIERFRQAALTDRQDLLTDGDGYPPE